MLNGNKQKSMILRVRKLRKKKYKKNNKLGVLIKQIFLESKQI